MAANGRARYVSRLNDADVDVAGINAAYSLASGCKECVEVHSQSPQNIGLTVTVPMPATALILVQLSAVAANCGQPCLPNQTRLGDVTGCPNSSDVLNIGSQV